MVEKKINFNQPILSVRRYETKTKNVVPRFRPSTPDLNSGPVSNPGAVPFQWEQIPGKPKEEIKRQAVIGDDDESESSVEEIDSVSITESFVSSCSMSSLHGDDIDDDDTNDSSRTFSMDPEVVKQEKPGFWYRPTFAKGCSYYNEKEVCGDDEHEKLLICCLLPRSCLKSSVGFVNPVPATSAVFPSTGILSGCSSPDSLSEAENEDENKKKGNVVNDLGRLESSDGRLSFVEGFGSRENSIKTLQELLADEDNRKELEPTCGDHFNIMSLVDEKSDGKGGIVSPKPFDFHVSEEKQKLSRSTTLGNSHIPRFPIPPPLPRSPSDSWLFRAMATKKASRSSSLSRCNNKT